MGLLKCVDCGKQFSDKLDNCPQCGCPAKSCEAIVEQEVPAQKDSISTKFATLCKYIITAFVQITIACTAVSVALWLTFDFYCWDVTIGMTGGKLEKDCPALLFYGLIVIFYVIAYIIQEILVRTYNSFVRSFNKRFDSPKKEMSKTQNTVIYK